MGGGRGGNRTQINVWHKKGERRNREKGERGREKDVTKKRKGK